MSPSQISIVDLTDAPHLAPTLERWFIAEWAPWYGQGGGGDAAADLAECCGRNSLPTCFVALNVAGEALGTIALKSQSLGDDKAPGPWLAAFLVAPAERRKGVGSALVAVLEEEARRLGFKTIYTSTDAAEGLLTRREWRPIGSTLSLRGEVTIMYVDL